MRLLVGFDRRDGGRDALELSRVLASSEQSSAVVVTVMPYDPLPMTYQELLSPGGGSVAGILTDLAERETFDAIVVGSAHHGALGRVLLGSVGHGLLHGAPCPVAVAPTSYAKAEQGTPVNPPQPEKVLDEGIQAVGNRVPVEGDLLGGPPAGSVTKQLIGMAPCPVLVVPRS